MEQAWLNPPNFEKAFQEGAVFHHQGKAKVRISVREAPKITLPTGRIIVCDPGFVETQCYELSVKPGTYRIIIADGYELEHKHDVTVCAKIQFSQEKIVRWELALLPGQTLSALKVGELFMFGVDTGLACFMDASVCEEMGREEVYEALLRSSDKDEKSLVLDEKSKANVVACRSGHGDGTYCSWWGLGKDGLPVVLVADFGLLTASVTSETVIEHPGAWIETPMANDYLKEADLTIIMCENEISRQDEVISGFEFIVMGPNRSSVKAEWIDPNGNTTDCSDRYASYGGSFNDQPCAIICLAGTTADLKRFRLRLRFIKGQKPLD